MLDIKLIRERPEFVKAELEKVGFPAQDLDALLELDRRRRAMIHETETLKARRSARSQEIRKITDPQER
ncbi:MAG: serine--tRNA ligase, partial [Deltaproteobacteria bacterium]|nr:serine--tRNA ligase [Deltaproteobacteria bacterium]